MWLTTRSSPAVVVQVAEGDAAAQARRLRHSRRAACCHAAKLALLVAQQDRLLACALEPSPVGKRIAWPLAMNRSSQPSRSTSTNPVPQPTYFWPMAAMPAAALRWMEERPARLATRCGTGRAARSRSWSPRGPACPVPLRVARVHAHAAVRRRRGRRRATPAQQPRSSQPDLARRSDRFRYRKLSTVSLAT